MIEVSVTWGWPQRKWRDDDSPHGEYWASSSPADERTAMIEVRVRWNRCRVANKRCRECGLNIMGSAVVRRRENFRFLGERTKHYYHPACGAIAKSLRDVR